jgi:hypothetical protein
MDSIRRLYKTACAFTPYTSIFTKYPHLLNMVSTPTPSMLKAMVNSLLAINDSVTTTQYPDRVKQRAFLGEKTVTLVHLRYPKSLKKSN